MFNFLKFQLKKRFLLVFHFTWKKVEWLFSQTSCWGEIRPSCSFALSHQCANKETCAEGIHALSEGSPGALSYPDTMRHGPGLAFGLTWVPLPSYKFSFFFSFTLVFQLFVKAQMPILYETKTEVTAGMTKPFWSPQSSMAVAWSRDPACVCFLAPWILPGDQSINSLLSSQLCKL